MYTNPKLMIASQEKKYMYQKSRLFSFAVNEKDKTPTDYDRLEKT